ncbi:hypothetical protein LguiA_000671 [Lonicera macranthoides]
MDRLRDIPIIAGIAAPAKWSRPLEGWLKCNMDASVSVSLRMGYGGIFRSANGEFVATIQRVEAG